MKPHAIWFTVGACFIGTGIYLRHDLPGLLLTLIIGFGLICVGFAADEYEGA